jgi:Tfp pilus assembly protein PilF
MTRLSVLPLVRSRFSPRFRAITAVAGGLGTLVLGLIVWDVHERHATLHYLAHHETTLADAHRRRITGIWVGPFERHLLAARVARQQGRFDEAMAELDAGELHRGDSDEVALERLVCEALQGDTDAAVSRAQTRWAAEPARFVPLMTALAGGHLLNCDPVEALKCAEQALKLAPQDPEALFYRGRARQVLGHLDSALEDYRQAMEVAPPGRELRLRLAETLSQLGYPVEAVEHLEALRHEFPQNTDVLLALARCRIDLAESDEARRLLEELLTYKGDHPAALLELASLLIRQGRAADAKRYLWRLLARSPGHRDGNALLCTCMESAGKSQEAAQCRQNVAKIEREVARVNRLIDKAVNSAPTADECHEIGAALLRQGREDEALTWLFVGLRRDPGHRPTQVLLAGYFHRAGQPARARRHAERAAAPAG